MYFSKVVIAMAAKSWRHLYDKNNSCHPVTLAWFSIQILVNFEIFKTLMKYFLWLKPLQGYNLSIHNRQFEPLKAQGRDLMTV